MLKCTVNIEPVLSGFKNFYIILLLHHMNEFCHVDKDF